MEKGMVRLPCDLANPLIADGKLKRVLDDFVSPSSVLWAVYLSRSYQLPIVRQFIDFAARSLNLAILSLGMFEVIYLKYTSTQVHKYTGNKHINTNPISRWYQFELNNSEFQHALLSTKSLNVMMYG